MSRQNLSALLERLSSLEPERAWEEFLEAFSGLIHQIVRLFEGQSDLVECISSPDKCPKADDCSVRLAWQSATQALYGKLDGITVADLMDGAPEILCDSGPCSPGDGRSA